MKLELFRIGNFKVNGYGTMIAIGFMAAIIVGTLRAKRKHMKDDAVIDIAIIAAICGVLGAKILYVIVSFEQFLADPLSVLGASGFVVYGGIIAGILAGWVYTRIKKLNFMDYFDLIMPEIAIAQGFGRLGCLLAGCCYGAETDSFLGIVFPKGCLAPAGVKLWPTQIFSAAGDIFIAVLLIVLADIVFKNIDKNTGSKKFGHISGDIACTYMFLYGTGRFVIEFFRNDYRGEVGFMSTSQFISIFIVLAGAVIMVVNRMRLKSNDESGKVEFNDEGSKE